MRLSCHSSSSLSCWLVQPRGLAHRQHVTLPGTQPTSTSAATQPAPTASTIPPIFGHKDRIQPRTTAVRVAVNLGLPMALAAVAARELAAVVVPVPAVELEPAALLLLLLPEPSLRLMWTWVSPTLNSSSPCSSNRDLKP